VDDDEVVEVVWGVLWAKAVVFVVVGVFWVLAGSIWSKRLVVVCIIVGRGLIRVPVASDIDKVL
jgi:hypothetical protein